MCEGGTSGGRNRGRMAIQRIWSVVISEKSAKQCQINILTVLNATHVAQSRLAVMGVGRTRQAFGANQRGRRTFNVTHSGANSDQTKNKTLRMSVTMLRGSRSSLRAGVVVVGRRARFDARRCRYAVEARSRLVLPRRATMAQYGITQSITNFIRVVCRLITFIV